MATKKMTENPGSGPDLSVLENNRVSLANINSKAAPGVKADGIKIRGTGAATKGTKARGPMA